MHIPATSHPIYTLVGAFALAARTIATEVSWISPAAGETFGPGDSLVGRWTSPSAIVTPSFRLCVSDGGGDVQADAYAEAVAPPADPVPANRYADRKATEAEDTTTEEVRRSRERRRRSVKSRQAGPSCGPAIWADVTQADGEYSVSLAIPEVADDTGFYLQIEDNFGQTYASPSFDLFSSSASSPNSTASHSISSTSKPVATDALLIAHRSQVPVAAYAIPVTIVGVIILGALLLFLRTRRRTLSERDAATRALSEKPASLSGGWAGGARGQLHRLSFGGWRTCLSAHSDVDVEKALVLADAMEVLAARGKFSGGRAPRDSMAEADDRYTALPPRSMPRGPRPRLLEQDLGSFDGEDILRRAWCVSPPAKYRPPPRFAYGPRETDEEYDEEYEAEDRRSTRPQGPRTVRRSEFAAALASQSPRPPSSDTLHAPPAPHRPPGLSVSPPTPGMPATASVLAEYMQPSPVPPTLPMPAFDGQIEEPIRREHPALLTPRLGAPPPPVPSKATHVRRPSGAFSQHHRQMSEEEAYHKVRTVVGGY